MNIYTLQDQDLTAHLELDTNLLNVRLSQLLEQLDKGPRSFGLHFNAGIPATNSLVSALIVNSVSIAAFIMSTVNAPWCFLLIMILMMLI